MINYLIIVVSTWLLVVSLSTENKSSKLLLKILPVLLSSWLLLITLDRINVIKLNSSFLKFLYITFWWRSIYLIPILDWKLKYSYSGKVEHALIYTVKYGNFELVKEIASKKKCGKFSDEKIIYYESTKKPIFTDFQSLLNFIKKEKLKNG